MFKQDENQSQYSPIHLFSSFVDQYEATVPELSRVPSRVVRSPAASTGGIPRTMTPLDPAPSCTTSSASSASSPGRVCETSPTKENKMVKSKMIVHVDPSDFLSLI